MGGHATVIWNFHFSSSISFLISQVGFSWLTPITTAGILISSKALSHSFFLYFFSGSGSGPGCGTVPYCTAGPTKIEPQISIEMMVDVWGWSSDIYRVLRQFRNFLHYLLNIKDCMVIGVLLQKFKSLEWKVPQLHGQTICHGNSYFFFEYVHPKMCTHIRFIKTFSFLWQNFPGIVCLPGNLVELSILTENKFSSHSGWKNGLISACM